MTTLGPEHIKQIGTWISEVFNCSKDDVIVSVAMQRSRWELRIECLVGSRVGVDIMGLTEYDVIVSVSEFNNRLIEPAIRGMLEQSIMGDGAPPV